MNTSIVSVFIGAVLALGVGFTLIGFTQMPEIITSVFTWDTFYPKLLFIVAGSLVVEGASRWFQIGRLTVGSVAAVIVTIVSGAVWPLLVCIWFALASFVVGLAILSVLRLNRENLSGITIFLIGASAYGTAVGILAHFPVNYPGLYGAALAAPLIFGWRSLSDLIRLPFKTRALPTEFRCLDLAIVLISLVHFSVALMPEVGHDALAAHLFISGHLFNNHVWGFDVSTYVWAVMPMMGDWLFSIGYMLAGETAARLINVGFIFALGYLIRELVLWAGGSEKGARWAVLLFLTTPLTFTESSSLFIESVWAAFVIAGSLSIFKSMQSDNEKASHLPIAGLLLGGALAAKAVTFTILPVLMLILTLRYRLWFRLSLIKTLLLGLVLFVVIGGIPYATAWLLTGNPVFPFFNQIFQSPFYPTVNFDSASFFGKGLSWDMLYQATFHTEKFLESRPGAPGFQWLLLFFPALLALFFSRQRRGILFFVVAGLSTALAFQSVTYLRYVFPSFIWGVAGIGVALSDGMTYSMFLQRSFSLLGWFVVALNLVFFKSGTSYGDLALPPLLSPSGRELYLDARLPIRNAVKLVNGLNVERTPVAVFSSPLTAGLNSDGLYPNWYNHEFQAHVNEAGTSDEIGHLLIEKTVDYVILDGSWGNADKRKIIEEATEVLAELGSISVRKIRSDYRYQSELLKNSDFSMGSGWSLSPGSDGQAGGEITVSVSSPAVQIVGVTVGHRYLYSATAVCHDQTSQGRLQVNWLDSTSKFINTDIRVFDCTLTETSHSMEVVAPKNAANAVVYASGHNNEPVSFRKISFKR